MDDSTGYAARIPRVGPVFLSGSLPFPGTRRDRGTLRGIPLHDILDLQKRMS